ncbi:GcrA cell cycle regulator [uncultured Caudovirales phage]|uniref:GcrA cell cycle regulator n=1 Tax=uncultured Caudovirales phage TaxID=2100421 RepID=A0A6J7XBQ7_9CAUD|nr:GcrA cell cycle regulator [uncultured Caudovirales phage]CAB4169320.1 GcrA cell cycle regulator [uncultured Caudovirales phage]CAB4175846.1 GcrA cell cycle regulator [uncultured Caudovirales phage]CAB4181371.1 GcrA cell cycle regulator [uncultured Caudovirales phage]CAB4191530.1 GcrA cell cycle regulator [uncultured Caudovirales phage]
MTDDLMTTIVVMWQDGKSGSQIGEMVNMTRSAVIARVNRLRAKGVILRRANTTPRPPNVPRVQGRGRSKLNIPVKGRPNFRREITLPQLKTFKAPDPSQAPHPSLRISLLELHSNSCRYITESIKASALFCGNPKKSGSSYCDHHHAVCMIPIKAFKEKEQHKLSP